MTLHRVLIPYKIGTWGWRYQSGNLWHFSWTFCGIVKIKSGVQ